MSDYGIKVSQEGTNVLESNDQKLMALWSKYKQIKITKRGNFVNTVPASTGSKTTSINHGLGYIPGWLAWYDIENNGKWWMTNTLMGTLSVESGQGKGCKTTADKTFIKLQSERGDYAGAEAFNQSVSYALLDQPSGEFTGGNGRPIGYKKSDHGIIVSSPGFNVLGSEPYQQSLNSNCEDLIFHKNFRGQLQYDTTANGQDSETFSHGLSYPPVFIIYGKTPTQDYFTPMPFGRSPQPFIDSGFCTDELVGAELVWAGAAEPSSGTLNYKITVFKNKLTV
jgi:hypothetical protein